METIQLGRTIAYGKVALTIYGEITEADAHNFAVQMAQDDALEVHEAMIARDPKVDPGKDTMKSAFLGVELMRGRALRSLARYNVKFKTAEVENIFKAEYTYAFFGYMMTLLQALHLSQNAR